MEHRLSTEAVNVAVKKGKKKAPEPIWRHQARCSCGWRGTQRFSARRFALGAAQRIHLKDYL